MEKLFVSVVLLAIVILFVWSIADKESNRKKTRKIFEELEPIVASAKTLEEVNIAWDIVENRCTALSEDTRYLTIDSAWREDYIRLMTICKTKIEMLTLNS